MQAEDCKDKTIHRKNSGDLQRGPLRSLAEYRFMLYEEKPKAKEKISLDSFLMNLNNSQSSDKAPAAVERLHNAGGTGWSLLREHAIAARIS